MYRIQKTIHLLVSLPLVLAISTSVTSISAQGPGGGLTATSLQPASQYSVSASKPSPSARPRSAQIAGGGQLVSVIVRLTADALANYQGGIAGLPATSPSVTGADKLDVNTPESKLYLSYLTKQEDTFVSNAKSKLPAAQIVHRYNVILSGVSMLVPASQVGQVSALPGVKAVYLDTLQHVDTDRTPQFIGAPTVWNKLGGQESAGDNVVIGMLDTGIWPEHPSFSDPDPSGKPYGPKPATWHGTTCQFGSSTPGDVPFTCNNKLIGATRVMATYDAVIGLTPGEFNSARDDEGHGTHTSSTAGGNASVAASIFGISRGIVSGIAPRARIAMYRVCALQGCFESDSAAAVERAIADGVNVINFSISGGATPFSDAVELAFLDAYNAGVFVAASAGNSGPGADTTDHRGPWVTTVAASTADRAFQTTATLVAGGHTFAVTGSSLTPGITSATPVVLAASAPYSDALCLNSTPDGAFTGKVVVCSRGSNGRAEKGFNVHQRGAVGMILYNQSPSVTDLETDNHYLPAVQIQNTDGLALLAFLAANPSATATWPAGIKATQQGDVMASFSSRGGPGQTLGVSKPDVTAPGVEILAGDTPQSVDIANGPNGQLFQAIAGTSMSSPHIAGSGALLKALHPNWTPGQIKSAIMTTAKTSVVKEDGVTPANAFDDGSGRVDLTKAGSAGLTFNETGVNYVALQDQLWNANYPSLYLPVMPGAISVARTVHNETNKKAHWKLSVSTPADVTVLVPKSIDVPANGNTTFYITVQAPAVPLGAVRMAMLFFDNDDQELHFPITFVRNQPVVTLNKTCSPASLPVDGKTTCVITATNATFNAANVTIQDTLPKQLDLSNKNKIVGVTVNGDTLVFSGTLPASQPPNVSIAPGTSPAGYLPLAAFGVPPISGVGDETISNFGVPAYLFGGQTYTSIGLVSDGYAVVGGGTGADIQFINQNLPDPAPPNNVLAPFWTDLNLTPVTGAGELRLATLTDGVNTWIVAEWNAAEEYGTSINDTFEIWIGVNGVEDISYVYGPVNGTGGGFLTVGAENLYGNRGQNYYYNGTGTLPTSATELRVTTTPGTTTSKVITFQALGHSTGPWQNCATLTSNTFQGTNYSCFNGVVTK